jgi:PTS system mannose-specific IIC component
MDEEIQMVVNVLIVSIIGGLLCLDRVFLLLMISRPIVAAPFIGFILGDPYTGLVAGAFTELLWIDRLPMGMYLPPNDTIASVLITASSVEAGRLLGGLPQGLVALSVLVFVPFGHIAQKMDILIVKGNEILADSALQDAMKGDASSIARRHFSPLLKTWVFSAGFIMVSLFAGIPLLTLLYPSLPGWSIRGLDLIYPMLPLVGTAVALNSVHVRGWPPIFSGIFLLGSVAFYYIKKIG